MASVNKAQALTFGAGFDEYPAVYIFGRLSTNAKDHFYRSDDAGQSWIRINEHSEKEVWNNIRTIAGDRNIPGRLYASASGQGVVFGGIANDIPGPDVTVDPEPFVMIEPVIENEQVEPVVPVEVVEEPVEPVVPVEVAEEPVEPIVTVGMTCTCLLYTSPSPRD